MSDELMATLAQQHARLVALPQHTDPTTDQHTHHAADQILLAVIRLLGAEVSYDIAAWGEEYRTSDESLARDYARARACTGLVELLCLTYEHLPSAGAY